ncbi:UNVERIFIED_CONTAM: SWI/SNF complex subunit SMARCC2 [Trichonephila clavipes]
MYLQLRRFDFQSPSRMDRNVEMFMTIEKTLVQNKCLTLPHIFIMPEVEKQLVPRLKDIIKRHQGTIAENPDDASHLVHPPLPTTDGPDKKKLHKLSGIPEIWERHRKFSKFCYSNQNSIVVFFGTILLLGRRRSPRGKYTIEEFYCSRGVMHLLLAGVDGDKKDKKSGKKRKRSPSPISEKRKRKGFHSCYQHVKFDAITCLQYSQSKSPKVFTPSTAIKQLSVFLQYINRNPSIVTKKKSLRGDDESDDLTKDMEEPSPEPSLQEVHIPKNTNNPRSSKDNESQPLKGGTLLELDGNEIDDKVNVIATFCL